MYQMMGVFAEFERAIIRERVLSGLARAKAEGVTLGRPSLEDADAAKVIAIKAELSAGKGIRRIARERQTGVGTVMRIKAALAALPASPHSRRPRCGYVVNRCRGTSISKT
jgi:DNA invertase Pin-like site-specific DNA recombinase